MRSWGIRVKTACGWLSSFLQFHFQKPPTFLPLLPFPLGMCKPSLPWVLLNGSLMSHWPRYKPTPCPRTERLCAKLRAERGEWKMGLPSLGTGPAGLCAAHPYLAEVTLSFQQLLLPGGRVGQKLAPPLHEGGVPGLDGL